MSRRQQRPDYPSPAGAPHDMADRPFAAQTPAAESAAQGETPAGGHSFAQIRPGRPAVSSPRLRLAAGAGADDQERAADAAADQALDGARPTGPPRAAGPAQAAPLPAHTGDLVARGRQGGQPLDQAARAALEPGFGHNFADVRVHADGPADQAARSLGALAFAVGRDIVFKAGQYRPASPAGRRLIAHELAHVAQGAPLIARKKDPAAPAAAPKGTDADAKAATTVALTISWTGKFNDDLSATVRVEEQVGKNKYSELASEAVEDKKKGDSAHSLSTTISVKRASVYRVTVTPTAPAPDDRYKQMRSIVNMKKTPTAASKSVALKLNIERQNLKNVANTWETAGIDPAKADDIVSAKLFGKSIRVNKLVLPRIERTNAAFAKLDKAVQDEIKDSIKIIGGYNKRTTSKGGFSDHSVGCALDMNYNLGTKQNAHLYKNEKSDKRLLDFVQMVVRTDPKHASFDIWKDKGQAQLTASQVFNARFPAFLQSLLTSSAPAAASPGATGSAAAAPAPPAAGFDAATLKRVREAAKTTKDATAKQNLNYIAQQWTVFQAWIEGAAPNKKKPDEKLVGMIPLHEQMLKLMLDNGWNWGGDWSSAKDYMHFQDDEAFAGVKKKKAAPKKDAAKAGGPVPAAAEPAGDD